MKIEISSLAPEGLKLLHSMRISDIRGYFAETYVRRDFVASGMVHEFTQDNESMSRSVGTVRGLHFQIPPFAQTKLVRVTRGKILDVVVDLRHSSRSYGKHLTIELSADSGDQLLVPRGFAHGFCTLEPDCIVFYKVDNVYSAEHERGVHWADEDLGIPWPVSPSMAIVSERDGGLPRFRELPVYFK